MPTQTTSKLTRERVAEATLALLAREGVDGISMRRVAAELGVGTMTLYGYFRDKGELMDAAVDLACAEIDVPPTTGPWKDGLRELSHEILRVLRRYPVAHQMRARGPLISAGALRSTEAGLEILQGAGFSQAESAQAWRLLFTYVFGFAAFTPATLSASQQRDVETRLAGMSGAALPRVSAAAAAGAAAMTGDEAFGYGLETILSGLELQRAHSN